MEPKAKADLTALREAWQDETCYNGLRRGNCGCSRCLDDLLRRGVEHGIELAMADLSKMALVTRAQADDFRADGRERLADDFLLQSVVYVSAADRLAALKGAV